MILFDLVEINIRIIIQFDRRLGDLSNEVSREKIVDYALHQHW